VEIRNFRSLKNYCFLAVIQKIQIVSKKNQTVFLNFKNPLKFNQFFWLSFFENQGDRILIILLIKIEIQHSGKLKSHQRA